MKTQLSRALTLFLALAIVPSCATRTGKIATGIATGATLLTVGVAVSPCTDDECGPVKAVEGTTLVGIAVVALIVAAVAEGRHHEAAPLVALKPSAPVPSAPRAPMIASAPARLDPKLVELTVSASVEASLGRCAAVDLIGRHVRTLDAAYFDRVFLADTAIQRCR